MEALKIRIQCPSERTKTVGTFLSGTETGKQYTKTYSCAVDLFDSSEYQILKNRIEK
jgi:hypothetical protein